ncbi:probable lipid droplet-associated hydrolase [Coccomyxa sp. Obi]|nr:probable lipid droplet-associated hydrolase [Coccomyxa sp. Obi]
MFSIRADTGTSRCQALVIPGNPGAAAYYTPFMQRLFEAFGGGIDIYSLSQLGHDQYGLNTGRVFNLREQIQHKVAFLKERMLLPGRPPIVILGHSIGSYIAMHAAHQIEQELHANTSDSLSELPGIVQILAIFPFLTVDPSCPRQRFLRAAASWASLIGHAAQLVGRLPVSLQRWVIQSYAQNLDQHALEATLGLFQRHTATNAFYLAQHEFNDLAAPADWWLLEYYGRRVAVLCAPSDMWFPEHQQEEMLLKVPKIQVHRMKDQRHDFCVSEKLSAMLAGDCASIMTAASKAQGADW